MNPTALVRGDLALALEEFDLLANQQGFVAMKVAPRFDVGVVASQFARIKLEQMLKPRSDDRAPGADYNRNTGEFDMDNYNCVEHGLEEPVDDREAKMFARYFDAERIAVDRARSGVLLNLEVRVSTKALAITANTPQAFAAKLDTAANRANAAPIDAINTAKLTVRNKCGFVPNCMVITYDAFLGLRECPQIVDKIKYDGNTNMRMLNAPQGPAVGAGNTQIGVEAVAQALGLEEIHIAGAVTNSANEMQAASLAPIWDKTKALLCYCNPSNDLRQVTFMRTLHWTEDGSAISGAVETYRDERVRSNIVRVRLDTDEKLIRAEAGIVLTTLL